MVFNVDVRFEEALAKDTSLPAILVDPTRSLENSNAVQKRLASLRPPRGSPPRRRRPRPSRCPTQAEREVAIPGVKTPSLPDLGTAPEFTDNQDWFNTPGNRPLTPGRAPRPRRADRLLDVHVHQLPAHAALPEGAVRAVPPATASRSSASRRPSSPSSRRRATSRRRSARTESRYPVVQDNKYGDLERLAEPVLAGRVPDRRQGQGPPRPVRRGRLQAERGGGPRAAGRRRRRSLPAPMTATRDHGLGRTRDARDLPRHPAPARLPGALRPASASTPA